MQIKINLQKNGTWKIFARERGGIPATRKTATSAYRFIESRLKRLVGRGEQSVLVNYGQSLTNETITSKNYAQLMHAFTVFMEDYLKPEFLNNRIDKYLSLSNTDIDNSDKISSGLTQGKKELKNSK